MYKSDFPTVLHTGIDSQGFLIFPSHFQFSGSLLLFLSVRVAEVQFVS